jgi:hypothetical protein
VRISSIGYTYQHSIDIVCNPATYGRVQIDEDGTGDVFAVAGFGEESLERASLRQMLRVGIRTTVGSKAVLEQVPGAFVSMRVRGMRSFGDIQLPRAVPQLHARLTNVEMCNLILSVS